MRAAARAAPRVVVPPLPGRHPGDVRRLAGGPHDQRIIRVSDHVTARGGGDGVPPAPGEQPDLRRPVHLVPAEVQQHEDAGLGGRQDGRYVFLIALEHRDRRVGGLAERRGHAGLHVGPERVGGDVLAERGQRGRDQTGRRRLAVRPGDQDDLPVLREHGQQTRLEPEPDDAADHRAVPRPASRETLLAAPPTLVASLARKGSLFIPADVIVTRTGSQPHCQAGTHRRKRRQTGAARTVPPRASPGRCRPRRTPPSAPPCGAVPGHGRRRA